MATLDEWEKRQYNSARSRRLKSIAQLASHLHEYSGYVLREVEAGRPDQAQIYAQDVRNDVLGILEKLAALDALNDIAFVFDEKPAET